MGQKASGERLYEGRVVNIQQQQHSNKLKLKHDVMTSGSSKGILFANGGDANTAFSALSLYRYRAAVRKQRKGDERGRRLQNKTFQNINRMDKKANRLMNGVSV